VIKTSKRHS